MMETVDNVKKTNTVDDAINDSQENTASGKKLCDKLKDIRKSVADKYELNYEPADCHHEGDCAGTCPKCDEELLDLQSQLSQKGITDIDVKQPIGKIADVVAPRKHLEIRRIVLPGIHRMQGSMTLSSPPPPHRRFVTRCQVTELANHKFDSIKHKIIKGAKLALIPDPTVKYGRVAVALALAEDYNGNPKDFNFDAAIGYISKKEKRFVSQIFKRGWDNCIEVEFRSIDGDKPNYDSITIDIYFKDKAPHTAYRDTDKSLFRMVMTGSGYSNLFLYGNGTLYSCSDFIKDGFCICRWGDDATPESSLPIKGDWIVFLDGSRIQLMAVIAKDQDCAPFMTHPSQCNPIKGSHCYILSLIAGPYDARELLREIGEFDRKEYQCPDARLSSPLTARFVDFFGSMGHNIREWREFLLNGVYID